jgi:DHA3 family macrolide efflux protein-like MFS transporter
MSSTYAQAQSPFAIFRNRNFRLMWIGQLVTEMGTSLTSLAASIYVYKVTGSALNVGLMMMASAAPSLVVGLIAGVFVDRYDRKRIMIAADLIRMALIVSIPFLLPSGIGWIYILVALSATVGQFFSPAHASVLPEIASEEELNAANSLMAISSFGSLVIGYAAAGLIISSYSIEWAFYIDAATFLISAILIYLTRIPAIQVDENTNISSIFQNLKSGIQVITTTGSLRSMFIAYVFIGIIFGFSNAIRLPFTIHALKSTEFVFGLLESVTLIGFVAASLLMANLGNRLREGQWLAISFIGMAFTGIFFSLSTAVWMALTITVFEGFMNAPSVIARALVIQRNTPREARGRVFSAFYVTRDVMFMTGMAMAGLADVFDVRVLYFSSSIVILTVGLLISFMPGLAFPTAEWKRILSLLRGVEAAPRLGGGRTASRSEIDRFILHMKALEGMSARERDQLAAQALVAEAPGGRIIVYRGETSDSAYFILKGSVGVGYFKDEEYAILNYLREGDFFGEIAALTGALRTANIITEEPSEFLIIPSKVLRGLSARHEGLRHMFFATIAERLSQTELPRGMNLDQQLLHELRTAQPDTEKEPAAM